MERPGRALARKGVLPAAVKASWQPVGGRALNGLVGAQTCRRSKYISQILIGSRLLEGGAGTSSEQIHHGKP